MITGIVSQFGFLETSEFQFHLTGSRAFNCAKSDSDWDFFCQNSPEVQDFLVQNDFYPDSFAGYETSTLVFKRENIHIQLVDSFESKLKANNEILTNRYLHILHNSLDKSKRKHLWNYLLNK